MIRLADGLFTVLCGADSNPVCTVPVQESAEAMFGNSFLARTDGTSAGSANFLILKRAKGGGGSWDRPTGKG